MYKIYWEFSTNIQYRSFKSCVVGCVQINGSSRNRGKLDKPFSTAKYLEMLVDVLFFDVEAFSLYLEVMSMMSLYSLYQISNPI